MYLRFSLREIFLVTLCVAIAIGSWTYVRRPHVSSSENTTRFPDGAEFTFVTMQAERTSFDCTLQHRIGKGEWREIGRFPRHGFSEKAIMVYESPSVNQVSTVTLALSGKGVLCSDTHDRFAGLSKTYISTSMEQVRTGQPVLVLEWTNVQGILQAHAFRLAPAGKK